MVDKPKCKFETLVEKFFEYCRKAAGHIDEKTFRQRKTVRMFRGNHPRVSKTIVVTVCTLAVSLVIVGFATPKTVTVNIDDSTQIITKEYKTTSLRVDSFIENHEIDFVYGQDIIDVEMFDPVSDGMEINIQKTVDIPVTADGKTQVVTTMPVTVKELLKELGIKVGEDDIVEPAMDHVLIKGDELQVKRVTTGYTEEEVTVDYQTRTVTDYGLAIGDKKVTQEGSVGKTKNTYLVTYIDGVEAYRELTESEVLQPKQDKIISVGMGVSSGAPAGLQYSEKISGVRAVAYYFDGNPRGSYGLPCTYGTCAVDPSVIPLGTKLYIEGYGYAIANDVGGAIKGNIVDLYMEDPSQCYAWGARTVNVYVIG